MNCEQIQEQISSMLDGELSEEDRAFVMEHLTTCPECRRVYEAFSAISDSLHILDDVPDGFTEDVMHRIHTEAKAPRHRNRLAGVLAMAACFALVLLAGHGFLSGSKTENAASISNYDADMTAMDAADLPAPEAASNENPEETEDLLTQAQLMGYDSAIIYQNSYTESETYSSLLENDATGNSAFEVEENESGPVTEKQFRNSNGAANSVNATALDEVLSVADTAVYGSFDGEADYTVLFLDANGNTCSLDVWVVGDRLYCEDGSSHTAYYASGTYAQFLELLEN